MPENAGKDRLSLSWRRKDAVGRIRGRFSQNSGDIGSGGSGIRAGTAFSGQVVGRGRSWAGQGARPSAKAWSHDFSLIRPPPPGAGLRLAGEVAGDHDSRNLIEDA